MHKAVISLLLVDTLDERLALPARTDQVPCLLLRKALESTLKLLVEQLPTLHASFVHDNGHCILDLWLLRPGGTGGQL